MVAPLPLPLMLRDTLMAAGLGFLLGFCYRLLRLVAGKSKVAYFICDGSIFIVGAVLYRSAAAGVFASGLMRWYTLAAVLMGYALVQKIFYAFFANIEEAVHLVFKWPFLKIHRYILCPIKAAWKKHHAKHAEKKLQRQKTPQKTRAQDLPNPQNVLYNSK